MAVSTTSNNCTILQESVGFCEGRVSVPGIRRRVFYTAKSNVVKEPTFPTDSLGRPIGESLTGNYELASDAVFYKLEGIPNKNQYTSEPQGELYSQTQNSKVSFFYPSIDAFGSSLARLLNNVANIVVFEDNSGRFRVLRNKFDMLKAEIKQDSGQGITGETGTTVDFSDTDIAFPPFYTGTLETEEGIFDCSKATLAVS